MGGYWGAASLMPSASLQELFDKLPDRFQRIERDAGAAHDPEKVW